MDSGSRNRFGKVLSAICLALLLATTVHGQVGTAFTYQGQLQNNGTPQNGPCDLRFKLFDSASGGNQFGSTQTLNGVNVANGLFTVAIDFGGSGFSGSASWLETAVTCPSGGSFTTLSPRQAMTPAPNAVFAENAATNSDGTTIVGNGTPVSKLSVAVPLTLQQTSSIATFYAANFGSAQGVAGFSAGYYGVQGKSTSS